jgi:hypothetical protein
VAFTPLARGHTPLTRVRYNGGSARWVSNRLDRSGRAAVLAAERLGAMANEETAMAIRIERIA